MIRLLLLIVVSFFFADLISILLTTFSIALGANPNLGRLISISSIVKYEPLEILFLKYKPFLLPNFFSSGSNFLIDDPFAIKDRLINSVILFHQNFFLYF